MNEIIAIFILISFFSISAAAELPTIWDETLAPPVPYIWNAHNFDGFYYDFKEDFGKEQLQILQPNLGTGQRIIGIDKIKYSTQVETKRLKVVEEAFNNNVTAAAAAGLEKTRTGQGFENGNYFQEGWFGQKYISLNGKANKLARLVMEHGKSPDDKKTLTVGETWNIGDGWELTLQAIDARVSPRMAWIILSKNGVKKDERFVSEKQVYTYLEQSIAGETSVPLFVTYIESIFASENIDMIQLRYTWAISDSITMIKTGDKYGIFEVVTIDPANRRLELSNTNSTINLLPNSTVNLMGSLKFKVDDRYDVLRFYPKIDYNITTASPLDVSAGGRYLGIVNTAIHFSGSANGGSFPYTFSWDFGDGTTSNLQNPVHSYSSTGLYNVELNVQDGSGAIKTANAGVDIINATQDTYWQLDDEYAINIVSIDARTMPRQVWLILSKNNRIIDNAVVSNGNTYSYYNENNMKIIEFNISEIFIGKNGNFIKLADINLYSESNGLQLMSRGKYIFKSANITGIDWQLNDGYVLRMTDLDDKTGPRQVWFELLQNNIVIDDAIISKGKTYLYNSTTNKKIFEFEVEGIFNGSSGYLVKLSNITKYSENSEIPFINTGTYSYRSENITGIDWPLHEGYALRMMDIDTKTMPRQVWIELLKNDIIIDDAILSWGQTYLHNNSGNMKILGFTVDEIFAMDSGNLVKLSSVNQYSAIDGIQLMDNGIHLYKSANTAGIDMLLNEGYALRMMYVDARTQPRQVWLELLENNTVIDDAVLWAGENYLYKNPSNIKILELNVDTIFAGKQVDLVKLTNINQYSVTNGIGLINNATNLYKTVDINGINWQLNEGYMLRMMQVDAKVEPRQVWIEMVKNNIILDETIFSSGQTYLYKNPSNMKILEFKVDSIFAGYPGDFVQLTNVSQYSGSDGHKLMNELSHIIGENVSFVPAPTPVATPTPTQTPSSSPDENLVSRYAGSDGIMQKSEAVQAVMDYFNGLITRQEAIAVLMAYFSG